MRIEHLPDFYVFQTVKDEILLNCVGENRKSFILFQTVKDEILQTIVSRQ